MNHMGFHVTTSKKLNQYELSGCIFPPVRFFPNEYTACRWAKRTGRDVILKIKVEESWPLPDHKPARWTADYIRCWSVT